MTSSRRSPTTLRAGVAVLVSAGAILVAAAPATAVSSADRAAAQAGVIVAGDMGAGWTETPYHHSDSAAADVAKIPACRRVKQIAKLLGGNAPNTAKAHSARFAGGDTKVDNSTSVFTSEGLAKSAFHVLSSPTFGTCIREIGNRAFTKLKAKDPKTAKLFASTSVSVAPQTLSLPADEETGLAMKITIRTTSGLQIDETLLFDIARVGRALDDISIEYGPRAIGPVPPAALLPSLQRLRTALQGATA